MDAAALGSTGLTVSAVGFPVGPLVRGPRAAAPLGEAAALLRAAHEAGITYFDVADVDGEGRGEALLAEAFGPADGIVVATTVGYDLYSPTLPPAPALPLDWTSEYVRYALERSLERLGRDAVDVYALHHPRGETVRSDELFALLDALVDEGLVRAIGVVVGPGPGREAPAIAALRNRRVGVVRTWQDPAAGEPTPALREAVAAAGAALVLRQPAAAPPHRDGGATVTLPEIEDAVALARVLSAASR